MGTKYKNDVPLYKEIVETERRLMNFFDWDISFQTAYHFLEMYLAMGVIFDDDDQNKEPLRVYLKSQKIIDVLIRNHSWKKLRPSQLAAYTIYKARKDLLKVKDTPLQL